MTDAQVEVAARAIRDVFAGRHNMKKDFDNLAEFIKEGYRQEARAALKAAEELGRPSNDASAGRD